MKKITLFLFLITFSFQLFSQKFVVAPSGIRSEADTTKNFIVIDFPNKSAKQLYNSVRTYIAKTSLHQPRVFLGDIPDNYLRTKSYTDNIGSYKGLFGNNYHTEGEFITTFEFKDKKLKISVSELYLPNNGATPIAIKNTITHPRIFNLDGSESKTYVGLRTSIESFLNSKLQLLLTSINGKNEDW